MTNRVYYQTMRLDLSTDPFRFFAVTAFLCTFSRLYSRYKTGEDFLLFKKRNKSIRAEIDPNEDLPSGAPFTSRVCAKWGLCIDENGIYYPTIQLWKLKTEVLCILHEV